MKKSCAYKQAFMVKICNNFAIHISKNCVFHCNFDSKNLQSKVSPDI